MRPTEAIENAWRDTELHFSLGPQLGGGMLLDGTSITTRISDADVESDERLSDSAMAVQQSPHVPKTGDLEARIAQRAEVPVHERLYDIARLEGRAMENERLREEREMRGVNFEPQLVSAPFARGN